MNPGLRFAWGQDNDSSGPGIFPKSPAAATEPAREAAALEEPTFEIDRYQVEKNTVLPMEKVSEIVSAYTGLKQRFADVEKARLALERAYHQAGYPTVLVTVPEQTIEGGVVRLEVIESTLGQVEIVGNRYFMHRYILNRLPSLRPAALLYEPAVTEELNRINANPDLEVTPVLSVGEIPGTVDLKLQVDDRLPLHGALEWNNRGTPNTPRHRLSATLQYSNLFDRDHIGTFQTTQTPEDWGEVAVYSVSYLIPLQRRGHLIAVYAARSDSKSVLDGSSVSIVTGDIAFAGNSTIVGGRYIFSLPEKEGARDQLSFGIDYKRLGQNQADFTGDPGAPPVLITPHLYYAPLSAAYTGSRFDERQATTFSASLRGYVAGMVPGGNKDDFAGDAREPDDPNNLPTFFDNIPANRQGSSGTFAVLQAGIEHTRQLPERFVLTGKVDGQLATEPLISAEQYFAGGIDTVRGYLENEGLGDDALHGSIELLSSPLPEIFPPSWKQNLRLAVYYDAAYLWVREAPAGQKDRFALAGFGLGMRLGLTDYIQARLDHAWAIRETRLTEKGDWFTHFLVRAAF